MMAWIALLVAVITGFSALGHGPLAGPPLRPSSWWAWAAVRAPELTLFSVLRLAVLILAWYLLAVTVVGLVARLARSRSLITVADLVTLPAIRRLLHTAVGMSLTAGSMIGPTTAAMASQAPPPVEVMTPLPAHPSLVQVANTVPAPPPVGQWAEHRVEQVPETARQWRVEAGQHFWSIAEQVLSEAWGRPASDDEVESYWRSLVEHNRSALADAQNPDLVYPGQVFSVPPVPPVPS